MTDPVVIVEYDPSWPARFADLRAGIEAVIGRWVVAVEHVGSTAVPGLAAKPVIDIMVGLRTRDDAPVCVERLVAAGWEYVPRHEDVMPFRRYLRRWDGARRVAHLHMVEDTHEFSSRELAFRDRLRADPSVAAAYEAVKRELAERYRHDRAAYENGKDPFIQGVLGAS